MSLERTTAADFIQNVLNKNESLQDIARELDMDISQVQLGLQVILHKYNEVKARKAEGEAETKIENVDCTS
jgi:hypothetical protein